MTWDNEREKRMEELWAQLDELDAELDATGLDDALEWERWDELESILGALAWNRAERWADRSERWAELAEMAEEAAMAEKAVFGSWDATPSTVEAFGVHEAIETQFAGVFGERR